MSEQNDMFAGALPKEIGQTDLATLTGFTVRRLQQLKSEGLPVVGKGRYNLAAAFQWFINRHSKGAEKQGQRERLLTAQATAAEIKNDEKLKQLIPVDIVSSTLNQVGVIIATQLEAMPPRLANELTNQSDPDYVKKIIDEETRTIRETIARLFDDVASGCGGGVDNPPAADKDG